MAQVTFSADYNHRWPSRAVTHFRAGQTYTVKREVRDAAVAKGKATDTPKSDKPQIDEDSAERGRVGRVDGRHIDASGNAGRGSGHNSHAGSRGSDELSDVVGSSE